MKMILLPCFLFLLGLQTMAFSQVKSVHQDSLNLNSPSSESALNLKDLFRLSLRNSERISISEQTIREAEALYRQALGSSFPELSFRYTTLWADRSGHSENSMFRVAQSSLTGYRELAAVRSGRFTIKQRKFEYKRVEQLLLSDLAAARGVTVAAIARTINSTVGGIRVGKYTTGGRRYDIRVSLRDKNRATTTDISQLWVRNMRGEMVSLADVDAFCRPVRL